MVILQHRPYIAEEEVRNALDSLVNPTERNLRTDSLKALRLVDNLLESPDYPRIEDRNYAVYQVLCTIISYELARLRQVHGLAKVLQADTIDEYAEYLRVDVQQNNDELRNWSILYHYYVRVELGLTPERLGDIIGIHERSIRRWRDDGVRRLTQYLIEEEFQARVVYRQGRLHSQIPAAANHALIGRDEAIQQVFDAIESTPDANFFVSGPPGIGKTHFVSAVVRTLIDDHVDGLLWISNPADAEIIFHKLYEMAQTAHEPDRLRQWLHGHRVIVVVDDAETLLINQRATISHLLHILEPTLTFLISREYVIIPVVVTHIVLGELPKSESMRVMHSFYRTSTARDPETSLTESDKNTIYSITGGNPLAIRLMIHNSVIKDLSTDDSVLDQLLGQAYESLTNAEKIAWLSLALCPPQPIARVDLQQFWPDLHHAHFSSLVRRFLIEAVDAHHYLLTTVGHQFIASLYKRGFNSIREAFVELIQKIEHTALEQPAFALKIISHILTLDWLEIDRAQRRRWAERFAQLDVVEQNPHEVGHIFEQLAQSASTAQYNDRIALNRGIAMRRMAKWEQAEAVFESIIQSSGGRGDFLIQSESLTELSIVKRYQGEFEKALKALERAEKLARRYRHRNLLDTIYLEASQINIELRSPQEALNYLKQITTPGTNETRYRLMLAEIHLLLNNTVASRAESLKVLDLPMGNRPTIGKVHNLLGRGYLEEKNLDSAFHHFSIARSHFDVAQDAFAIARCDSNIGAVLIQKGNYDEAWDRLNSAYKTQSSLGDKLGMLLTKYNLETLRSHRQ